MLRSSSEAVCHVKGRDVLAVRDRDDFAEPTRSHDLVQCRKERRVSQYVSYAKGSAGRLGRPHQIDRVGQGRGHGLFEEHVVPGAQRARRSLMMESVGTGDDRDVGELARLEP